MITVQSATLIGTEAVPIRVEVDLLRRLPATCIVGMPASAARETSERVRSAIEAAGAALGGRFEFPRKRVVVNLAPADLRKNDPAVFDLPIAVGILVADGVLPKEAVEGRLFVGPLGLDGDTRNGRGVVAMAELAYRLGLELVCPAALLDRVGFVPKVRAVGCASLLDVLKHVGGAWGDPIAVSDTCGISITGPDESLTGQHPTRLTLGGLQIRNATVGDQDGPFAEPPHHALVRLKGARTVLLSGPPGSGRTRFARALHANLGPMTGAEAIESFSIFDAAGLGDASHYGMRPFRAPHHSISIAGLTGDQTFRPGEVSLAHHGTLFLDKVQLFGRGACEIILRPVLTDGEVRVSRPTGTVRFPAKPALVVLSCTPETETRVVEQWKPDAVVRLAAGV